MPIRVKCPKCERMLTAKDESAGRPVRCPGCGQVLRLPGPAAEQPAAPADAPKGSEESRSAKASQAAEERKERRRLEKERRDKRNRVTRIIAFVGVLIGGLLGGLTYPFDLPSAKTGIYYMAAGVLTMGICVILLFVTPKPKPEPTSILRKRDAPGEKT